MCSKRYSFAVDSFKYLGIAAASQSSFNAIFIATIIPFHLSKKLLWMTSPTVQSNEDELSLDWLHVHHFVIQNCHFD